MELLEICSYKEIEEIIYNFGTTYIENKLKKKNGKLTEKLNKLIRIKEGNKDRKVKFDYNK